MKLMTKEIEKKFEKTGSQDGLKGEAVVIAKFFTPDSNWTWYALEWYPEERNFFGIVEGFDVEYGYFNLDELMKVRGQLGLPIERDMWYEGKVKDIQFSSGKQWFQES